MPSGRRVEPEKPNAVKFERFIFDLMPADPRAIVVEVDAAEHFAPLKNASGQPSDTPETVKARLVALHSRWLREAGAEVAAGVDVEISPLWALDAAEVARQTDAGDADRQSDVYWRVIADAAEVAGTSAAAKRTNTAHSNCRLSPCFTPSSWPGVPARDFGPPAARGGRTVPQDPGRPLDASGDRGPPGRADAAGPHRHRHHPVPGRRVRQELPELPPGAVLAEPCPRNTAPCIGLAAIHALRNDPDATLAVLPADQVIAPQEVFQDALRAAAALVEEDPRRLVTFGIKPQSPSTGFGYIERGEIVPVKPRPCGRGPHPLTAWPASTRSRSGTWPSGISRRAATIGTPACSSGRPARSSMPWPGISRRWPRAWSGSRRRAGGRTTSRCWSGSLPPCRGSPSTTPSWSMTRRPSSWRRRSSGTTWGVGRPGPGIARPTSTATTSTPPGDLALAAEGNIVLERRGRSRGRAGGGQGPGGGRHSGRGPRGRPARRGIDRRGRRSGSRSGAGTSTCEAKQRAHHLAGGFARRGTCRKSHVGTRRASPPAK